MKMTLETIKAVVLGHAVADALGVPAEFRSRESMDAHPVTDMTGYGTHPVPAGTWSDDTSMAIATLDALAESGADCARVADGFYRWYKKAEYTATGRVFDIGGTCARVISSYENSVCGQGDSLLLPAGFDVTQCGEDAESSNGNGSLMRLYPFVLYACGRGMPFAESDALADRGSALTHAHPRSRLACRIYALLLTRLLDATPAERPVRQALHHAQRLFEKEGEIAAFGRLFGEDFANIPRNGIKSSGYVVDTLEAAVWCLLTTDSYAACVLKAVNLGEDTDTVAAVAGSLAGVLYGLDAIPAVWLNTLKRREYPEELCIKFAKSLDLGSET